MMLKLNIKPKAYLEKNYKLPSHSLILDENLLFKITIKIFRTNHFAQNHE